MQQQFKSIYFPSNSNKKTGKSITISFSEKEENLFLLFSKKNNNELRTLVGDTYLENLIEHAEKENRNLSQYIKNKLFQNLGKSVSGDVTFRTSKKTPFQRWFNYAEGYSAEFVKNIINKYFKNSNNIYDPFAGTGTTIFACNDLKKNCFYSEVNPVMAFQIQTKLGFICLSKKDKQILLSLINHFIKNFDLLYSNSKIDNSLLTSYKLSFENSIYFSKESFEFVLKIKNLIRTIELDNQLLANVISMTMLSILLSISKLKRSGDVRFKTKKELEKENINPIELFKKQLTIIRDDIISYNDDFKIESYLILLNAKKIKLTNSFYCDGIITSPPYLNGTNYIRNTKLELWFMDYLKEKDDLRFFRNEIITSGINDVISSKENTNIIGASQVLDKTIKDLKEHAYDTRIPLMAEQYFSDMYETFSGIKEHLSNDANIAIDIGDSIFGGIHIPTDLILKEILTTLNYKYIESINLRERRSRSGEIIKQVLLIFKNNAVSKEQKKNKNFFWNTNWKKFKETIPYQQLPFSKRNWGNKIHSLCSYQGKLKPAIAHFLVDTFVPENGTVLDVFSGVGTIPFEARLSNKKAFGFDISLPAYYISSAKMGLINLDLLNKKIEVLNNYIQTQELPAETLEKYKDFGFNGKIYQFYEGKTYKEILLARRFFIENPPKDTNDFFIISALLHILHGNRPYALSRRSHPIVPYAPTGEYTYKNLIGHLKDKVIKDISDYPNNKCCGEIYLQDSTSFWPTEINNIDAIITSPPFFDSTRFYSANWIRLWFCGWEENDFQKMPKEFIDERQKNSFDVYESIFLQARERLSKNGVLVLHLGQSKKCNMAEELVRIAKKWFKKYDLFSEDVSHCEKFGIKDVGTVEKHQFLVLI